MARERKFKNPWAKENTPWYNQERKKWGGKNNLDNQIVTDKYENEKDCGKEYRDKVKCTKLGSVYGPIYRGAVPLKDYSNWDKLISDKILSIDEKEILVGMSKNEGNLDAVQSYDNQLLTVGAMQKTLRSDGKGQFYTQVSEFKNENKTKYEELFEGCGWKVDNNKLTYKGLFGNELKTLIRKGFSKDTYGKTQPSIPIEPIIKACYDKDFQKKQVLDFVEKLKEILKLKPSGFSYTIKEYFKSNFSRAVILDQRVNRPAFVQKDLGEAMERFFTKNSFYSQSPLGWNEKKQYDFEMEVMEDYGNNRRGTDMKKRYSKLKKHFLNE